MGNLASFYSCACYFNTHLKPPVTSADARSYLGLYRNLFKSANPFHYADVMKEIKFLTSVVYTVQIIPVENRDPHMLSPETEIKKRVNIYGISL